MLKFRLRDMNDLNHLLLNHLRKIPGLGQTETFLVLENVL
ncbi:MAG: Lrp/AsnC ligand binding domain-containing protein [Deltaproteobacteria bacterium]|nr:Lrp/AsnC ligand binding domain-containing protein [Deltaproteobacteria bacterium]